MEGRKRRKGLKCIGAVPTQVTAKKGTTDEWHYYIMRHARSEWAVESMHWLLDVHFDEDKCRVQDRNVQI